MKRLGFNQTDYFKYNNLSVIYGHKKSCLQMQTAFQYL